jgi:hypothetical protein
VEVHVDEISPEAYLEFENIVMGWVGRNKDPLQDGSYAELARLSYAWAMACWAQNQTASET